MRHLLAHMRSQKSLKKIKKTLEIWMDILIQFLRHPFLSNMNNKIWFYQSSNFFGNRIFLSFKLFGGTHMRQRDAHMRQRERICVTYRTVEVLHSTVQPHYGMCNIMCLLCLHSSVVKITLFATKLSHYHIPYMTVKMPLQCSLLF